MMFLPSLRSSIGTNYGVLLSKIVAIATIFMFVGAAQAAAPLAGTSIGNQDQPLMSIKPTLRAMSHQIWSPLSCNKWRRLRCSKTYLKRLRQAVR